VSFVFVVWMFDLRSETNKKKTLDKKILEHSLYNYILVVGGTEEQNKSVNVRKRKEGEDEVQVGRDREVPLHVFIQELSEQIKNFH
jgi:threonyl-tRNA synthetase